MAIINLHTGYNCEAFHDRAAIAAQPTGAITFKPGGTLVQLVAQPSAKFIVEKL